MQPLWISKSCFFFETTRGQDVRARFAVFEIGRLKRIAADLMFDVLKNAQDSPGNMPCATLAETRNRLLVNATSTISPRIFQYSAER
jgi:hypothetical protein